MYWKFLLITCLVLTVSGCNDAVKQKELQLKEDSLLRKEQELIVKEKALELRENELNNREQSLDSNAVIDSTHIIDSSLVGNWLVKMTCTETSCASSAVGDTKTEDWQISYEARALIAKAMANNEQLRVYTGYYIGNTIELVDDKSIGDANGTKMIVRLRIVDPTHLEGQREIVREDCKVIYSLTLEKKKG
ncbi:MAG: hypothetical protein ACXWV0_08790 [Flavisolibacter sp.]